MKRDIVVLIPHYNNPAGLRKSLASIEYTMPIDVLIVDDGSSKKPDEQGLHELFKGKLNLNFIYNKVNQGIEGTLNIGLKYIQEQMAIQYIARLDCGDTCNPLRFIKQKQILDDYPDFYLIGSWVDFVDDSGRKIYTYKAPSNHKDIVNNMFLKCSFIHPSVMFRAAALHKIGLYPTKYKAAEDYAFFFNFVKTYKTHIIQEVLTYCEVNYGGISVTKRNTQLNSKLKILYDNKAASPYFILGLARNFMLKFIPYTIVAKAKALLLK
ncbi:glycosyltransferase [uncultured Pontibacter sp.]|uniref:glycosyltransferase n=1 Tax=uncultured Pontibacter sp. TaxID=453356 RepID=UPI0026064873|nr:glycosyltransferase [uncultured Pontibacter sp.]